MKKLMILSPIHAAVLFSVLFLASCGGDDDTPTDPGSDAEGGNPTAGGFGRLDSRLFGTWIPTGTGTDSEVVAPSVTFREDGSGALVLDSDDLTLSWDVKWWIEGGQLMVAYVDTLEYAISNGELTFTAVNSTVSILNSLASLGAVFTADGDPVGLTGVRWVCVLEDEDIEIVFSSEGTVSLLSEESDELPWTNGTWIAEGRTIAILWEPFSADYEVRGKTLTLLFDPDGDQVVYSKQ